MVMRQMVVADVMTRAVVSAYAGAGFKEIVAAMARNRIDVVPVLGEFRQVLGVVSASDLLTRISGDRGEIPRGHRLTTVREQHRKARGLTAAELMTAPAITVADDLPVREAARRCARFHVRCMPVLDQAGELIGIVTRSDLLRPYLREDAEIRRELVEDVVPVRLLLNPTQLTVSVSSGMVTLSGEVPRRTDAVDLVETVRALDGVIAVRDRLRFRTDDLVEAHPAGR